MAEPTRVAAQDTVQPRRIEYLSAASPVSMADPWFDIATTSHFWIRRRFKVLQCLADPILRNASQIAEIGCGHGVLQHEIEENYGKEVVGFDLNEYALRQNISKFSRVCCYDILELNAAFRSKFDVIFLFDVLEHIADEEQFLKAVLYHLSPKGTLIVNVPAGQWAFSMYDRAVGHLRRYSISRLSTVIAKSGLAVVSWSYWGLPLVPALMVRKVLLMGKQDKQQIISTGMDSRTPALNGILNVLANCELVPQKILGASLMAILELGER